MPCEPIKGFSHLSLKDFNVELLDNEAMFKIACQFFLDRSVWTEGKRNKIKEL